MALQLYFLAFFTWVVFLVHSPPRAFALSPNSLPPLPTTTSTSKDKKDNYHTSDFTAKQNHPTSYNASPAFLGPLRILQTQNNNTQEQPQPQPQSYESGRERIQQYYQRKNIPFSSSVVTTTTTTTKQIDQSAPTKQKLQAIVDHLARSNAPVDVKEVCESMEFVLRTRKRLLGAVKQQQKQQKQQQRHTGSPTQTRLYDLCCGHGLTGMLFGCLATTTSRNNDDDGSDDKDKHPWKVILVDQTKPPSHEILLTLLTEVCPWIAETIQYKEASLDSLRSHITSTHHDDGDDDNHTFTATNNATATNLVISTHACGSLTDQVLELATVLPAVAVAVMPCCYTGTSQGAPYGVQRALGVAWAADIQRSMFLEEAGYHSDFATIPREITPMNRILLGEFRGKLR